MRGIAISLHQTYKEKQLLHFDIRFADGKIAQEL
jgi:hypothetical protein